MKPGLDRLHPILERLLAASTAVERTRALLEYALESCAAAQVSLWAALPQGTGSKESWLCCQRAGEDKDERFALNTAERLQGYLNCDVPGEALLQASMGTTRVALAVQGGVDNEEQLDEVSALFHVWSATESAEGTQAVDLVPAIASPTRSGSLGKLSVQGSVGHDPQAAKRHDLANILAGVRATRELLQQSGESLSVAERQQLEAALERQSKRARQVLDACGEFSEHRSSPGPWSASTRPEEVLRDAVHLERAACRSAGVQLRLESSTEADGCRAHIDALDLTRVLVNLLANARESLCSARGRAATHSPSIEIKSSCKDGAWRLLIRDNGPGLAAPILARLFEPGNSDKQASGRTRGLGLWSSRRLVQGAGGVLECQTCGEGATTFRLELPIDRARD